MNPKIVWWLGLALTAGCATTPPPSHTFDHASTLLRDAPSDEAPPTSAQLDDFVDYALRHRPELRANLARWRAARAEVDTVRQAGEFEVGYRALVLPLTHRVGHERHAIHVGQTFPWFGSTARERDARAAAAEEHSVVFDQAMVDIRWQVFDSYWTVWAAQQQHAWHEQHIELLRAVTEHIRGQVEVGNGSVADIARAELAVSQTANDRTSAHFAHERSTHAFARAIGRDSVTALPNVAPGVPRIPTQTEAQLVEQAARHPNIRQRAARRATLHAERDALSSRRAPMLGVSVEWMEMGAADAAIAHSGRDQLMAGVSVMLPVWTGELRAQTDAIDARIEASVADEVVSRRELQVAVRQALVDVRDTARAIQLYAHTIVPQAEAMLGSVRGAYEVGQTDVSALLLASNDLLEVHLTLVELRAEHERAWATLERVVATPVASQEAP